MKLLIVNGKSGSGKDTVVNELIEMTNHKVKKVILYTTRTPRANEKDGEDYFFLNPDNCKDFIKYSPDEDPPLFLWKKQPTKDELITYKGQTYYYNHNGSFLNYKGHCYRIIESRSYFKKNKVVYFYTIDDGQIDTNSDNVYVTINTPSGTKSLLKYYKNSDVKAVKIEVNELERLKRAFYRSMHNENSGKIRNFMTFIERELSDLKTQRNDCYYRYGLGNIEKVDNTEEKEEGTFSKGAKRLKEILKI